MRIGTMIGDAVERIPLFDVPMRFVRMMCRKSRKRGRRGPSANAATQQGSYAAWVRAHDTPTAIDLTTMRNSVPSFAYAPTISVVMPVFDPSPKILEEAIQSVRNQAYDRWELCIADDVSTVPEVRTILERHAAADPRIKVRFRTSRGNISAASNTALEMATGEFVALFDHDDILPPHALYWVAEAINRHPDAALLYSDEDKIDGKGRRFHPYFKCDFNHELLLSQNMVSHLGVYRRDLIVGLGGFRSDYDGSQDHDLALRIVAAVPHSRIVHIPRILYHWRAVPGSTAISMDEKQYSIDAGRRAVADHLSQLGRYGAVEPAPEAPCFHRVRHTLPTDRPLVSIVICTRDHGKLLQTAVNSITSRSTYDNYEITIVDNGSRDGNTLETLRKFAERPAITVIRDDSPFNYSKLNNMAVAGTRGDVVCLLNDDIEVLSPNWLEEMVALAIVPDVAAVGARLWYPDGTLQHGGVIIGIGGVANHAHLRLPKGHAGYAGRAVLQQEFSAVTGACLVVRRCVFDEVGGLDEQLAVAFNDVDFCLRLRSAGYRNVWTPYAELVHHESASRGAEDNPVKLARFQGEVRFMQERWGTVLHHDPYYSPHLSTRSADFTLALSPGKAA
jgi:O-antigen biosynthesis protein